MKRSKHRNGKEIIYPQKDAGVENVNRKFRQNNQFYHFY